MQLGLQGWQHQHCHQEAKKQLFNSGIQHGYGR
jgi:hypothetical protein